MWNQQKLWRYLGHGAVQADVEAQLSQAVPPQRHVHRLTSHRQRLDRGRHRVSEAGKKGPEEEEASSRTKTSIHPSNGIPQTL